MAEPRSVVITATAIAHAVGAPDVLVHNAGITAAGMVEETPISLWECMVATNIFGPVALTKALLPAMRAAGGAESCWCQVKVAFEACRRRRPILR